MATIGTQLLDLTDNGLNDPEPVPIADAIEINCVEAPPETATPTATFTPLPPPSFEKQPELTNLWLTRQGTKLPPAQCIAGSDTAVLEQSISAAITSPDPKEPEQPQQLGAFEFEVHYDEQKVCVELEPGAAAQGMACLIEDAVTKPALEGVARIGCLTLGKERPPAGVWEFFADFGFAGTISCTISLVEEPAGILTAEGPCTTEAPLLDVGTISLSGPYDGATGAWAVDVPCHPLICPANPPLVAAFDLSHGTFEGTIGPIVSGGQLPEFASVAGTKTGEHPLANVIVRPQPEVYSQAIPNQANGVVVQLVNQKCELADLQGHAIAHLSCDDADVTARYLEGDVEPDCVVDTLDTQGMAFRWGANKGGLLYLERFNLEPSGTQADDDIDIKDLQFVYGRFGSTCDGPHPDQDPVNPKE